MKVVKNNLEDSNILCFENKYLIKKFKSRKKFVNKVKRKKGDIIVILEKMVNLQ